LLSAPSFAPCARSQHAGQSSPHIVRDIIGDLLHLGHQRFDALEHRIEVLGELIPFVPRPAQGYPPAKTALQDGSAGRANGFDPSYSAPRDGDAGHRRKNKYQSDPPYHPRPNFLPALTTIA